jgi:peroxiredoxin
LAEYRELYGEIRNARADVAAVAVDPPHSSAAVRQRLALPFPILCDSQRAIVKAWGVFNAEERGGIAIPAVFVVDHSGIVRFASVDSMTARISAKDILGYLQAGMPNATVNPPRTRLRLQLGNLFRAVHNAIKSRIRSPQKS